MLNPLTYKLVWLGIALCAMLGAILPPLLGPEELAIITVPAGAVLLAVCIARLRKRRRIRLPRRKRLH